MNYELNRGPFIRIPDYFRPGLFKVFPNPEWKGIPEIISFTDFLKWNYISEYGIYVRKSHYYESLTLPFGVNFNSRIVSVEIVDGKYDRIDETKFNIYVIVAVVFNTNGVEQHQRYCVTGYCDVENKSDFFQNIEIYNGEYIRLRNQLDDHLVPILSKRRFSEEAKKILQQHCPRALYEPVAITGYEIAKSMGYTIRYERLSKNGKIKAKLIFDTKLVTLYTKDGKEKKELIDGKTILVDKLAEGSEAKAIVHECIHIYEHRLFYELQTYYHRIVGVAAPEFNEYFYSLAQEDSLRWMEIQADAITRFIRMPDDTTTDVILEYMDKMPDIPEFNDYRNLIDHVKATFDETRYSAKKRIAELGWTEVRGVFEYLNVDYVEDFMVDANLPLDHTYTIKIREIAEIAAAYPEFDKLISSGKYIYVDGHVCFNDSRYVDYDEWGIPKLTDTAKYNMNVCCLSFKKVYKKHSYTYTYGELNKEALSVIEECDVDADIKKRIHDEYHETTEVLAKLKKEKTNSELGRAIVYHMKRCNVTNEELAERTWLGSTTITKLRSGRGKIKLETILAFCIGLELEETVRNDLMVKAKVSFDPENKAHNFYLTALKLYPKINIFQLNKLLVEENLPPLTREDTYKKKMAS